MEQVALAGTPAPALAVPAPATSAPEPEEEELSGLEAKIALAPRQSLGEQASPSVAPADIPRAPFFGSKVVAETSIDEIYHYINERALIRGQWQVKKGSLSEQAYEAMVKEKIYPDFARLKKKAKQEGWLSPKVVYGYYPCQSQGDDLIIYRLRGAKKPANVWNVIGTPAKEDLEEFVRFTFPRQAKGKRFCLADFFASVSSGRIDVAAFHLVTMGAVASEHAAKLYKANNYKEYLYFHGLGVESAEALAELWHKKIREELDIAGKDDTDTKKLFSQHYQGSRYSFGYPACPRLEDQEKLFRLLEPERIGVTLTEEFQLVPEQSTSAIVVHHPEARYFHV
jgi:5-methyltetrahydrofolate--homocysteine methyltransferase